MRFRIENKAQNKAQKCIITDRNHILLLIKENPSLTQVELSAMMDKSRRAVQIPVKELLDEGEIGMNRTFLREMAGETIRITNEGGYELNGKHISLVGNDFSTVRVL